MARKVLVLTLISLLVLSVSIFGAMKPKVEDEIMRKRLERMEKQNYPDESIITKYITTPTQKMLFPASDDTVGFTYYDYQHNDVMRRMIANGTDGNIHFTWMSLPSPPIGEERYMDYNSCCPWLAAGGMHVTEDGQRGGYGGLDLFPDQREVLYYHRTQPTPNLFWGATISIEEGNPGDGTFGDYDIPDSVQGVADKGEWPTAVCSKYTAAHNYIHITHAEGVTSGSEDKDLFYLRCYESGSGTLTCESPGWSSSIVIPKEKKLGTSGAPVNRVCYRFDVARLGGVTMATSPVSQKVAIVWLDNYAASQTQNELKYVESTNNGDDWIANPATMVPIQLTNYQAAGAVDRAYDDLAVIYDYNDNLHIMWTTFKSTDQNDVTLWHWTGAQGIRKAGFASAAAATEPGAWNLLIAKFNLGIYQPDNTMYLTYTKFKDGDISAAEYANGDICAKGSTNYGLTWGPEVNLTNTNSNGCAAGECESEHWSSLAERIDNFLHIQYIYDRDAGGIVQDEGSMWNDPVRYLKYARFPIPALASLTYSPTRMITPYRHALNGGNTSEDMLFDNVGTATLYVKISGPSWATIVPNQFNIIEAGPSQTVNVTFQGGGLADTFLVDSLKIESNHGNVGEVYTNVQWVKVHFVVTDNIYFAEWATIEKLDGDLKVKVSNVGNIGNQEVGYMMNYKGKDFCFEHTQVMSTSDVMGRGPVGWTWLHDHHDFLAEANVEVDTQFYAKYGVIVIYDKLALPIPGRHPIHREFWPWWSYWTKYSKIIIQPKRRGICSNWIRVKNWYMKNPPPIWWDDIPSGQGYPTGPIPGYFGIAGDWDVPSDASGKNLGDYDTTLNLIYQYADSVGFEKYYGGYQFLNAAVIKGIDTTRYTKPIGAHVLNNAEQLYPWRGYNDDSLWKYMSKPGWSVASDSAQDMNIVISMVQETNPDNSTIIELEYALIVSDQGLDSLKDIANKIMKIKPGDANVDGKVSVSDVVYLINYLFKGGPEPWTAYSDVNGDGKISVSDVVYLINYLFKGGLKPVQPPWCTKLPPW